MMMMMMMLRMMMLIVAMIRASHICLHIFSQTVEPTLHLATNNCNLIIKRSKIRFLSPLGDLEMDLSGDIPSHPSIHPTFRFDCSKHL